MKQRLLILVLLLFSNAIVAQELQGSITYQGVFNDSIYQAKIKDPSTNPEMRKAYEIQMNSFRQYCEKTYILNFNRRESICKEIEKLELESPKTKQFTINQKLTYYKNFEKNLKIEKREMNGNRFLIHDTIPFIKWQLTSETKKIGDFICYRAFTRDTIMGRDRKQKEDGTFEIVEYIQDIYTTNAWYALDIPINNGPLFYGNLPGLIMELEINVKIAPYKLVVTDIKLNPKKPIHISAPKGGTIVYGQEGFEKELRKLLDGKK